MLARIRTRLTYANVTATLALFLAATGGIAWALEANSVKSKHIRDGHVKKRDLAAAEDWHVVGAPGETAFHENSSSDCQPGGGGTGVPWSNSADAFDTATAFYRDPYGVVHLKGVVSGGTVSRSCPIFELPPGYRPLDWRESHQVFSSGLTPGVVLIFASNNEPDQGWVLPLAGTNNELTLDGITFRCAPSGQDGCP